MTDISKEATDRLCERLESDRYEGCYDTPILYRAPQNEKDAAATIRALRAALNAAEAERGAAVAAEREACANLADEMAAVPWDEEYAANPEFADGYDEALSDIAAAIRARTGGVE